MDETNPVVLQASGKWHIVEHSRRSKIALCGQVIANRGAHARLNMVAGTKHACAKCLKIFNQTNPPGTPTNIRKSQ